ncbi:polysaccharide pyruvyl transferase family protein [Virgibacillus halodenitrificans]|uniref:polysaccharide pyruvyl transferase family protein n=1 Tax=Virgibacillus halodenitrificans TaxID=1482 RepID=UPI000EF52981|nr:polysaccharide pyruvyl transferase family protein [Virgibacillus halodenitrificans]MCG1027058.1 polysaccharide pyruvyl transferase family protein [Virgibacillus halodenitrificans]
MRIGIVGNYGNNNQGDEAILEGILVQLKKATNIQSSDIIVFTNNPEQAQKRYGVQTASLFEKRRTDPMKFLATVRHHLPIIRELDLLIIGGGGILMDLYRNNPIVYGMYSWIARRAKTPTVIYGPGVGPLRTFMGKTIIRSIANHAEIITVRDPQSKNLLHSIGVKKNIQVITDPAFFVEIPEKLVEKREGFHIGVTAVPYFNKSYWPKEDKQKYNDYINGMSQNLDNLLEKRPMASIHFFSTKHPYDTVAAKDIQKQMVHANRTTLCNKELTHREILDFVNQQDLIIGTRLHSLILSVVAKKPILGISYHQKVRDFMRLIDCSDQVIDISEVHSQEDAFLSMLKGMERDWKGTVARMETILIEMKTKEPNGMTLIKQAFPHMIK